MNNPIAFVDLPFKEAFECLSPENMITLFTCVLLEKQVLLVSSQMSLLTAVAEVLRVLLYPFTWHHVYIPVLPRGLMGVLQAPMPFIVGVHTSCFDEVRDEVPHCVVQVFLDSSVVNLGDNELPVLPPKSYKKLLDVIRTKANSYANRGDMWEDTVMPFRDSAFSFSVRPMDADTEMDVKFQWMEVRDGFLRFFVSVMKKYRHYLVLPTKANPNAAYFNGAGFLKSGTVKADRPFMTELCETQAFQTFVDERVQPYMEGQTASSIAEKSCDVIFFDESIDAKNNRSFWQIAKRDTPFLRNTLYQIHKTVMIQGPSTDPWPGMPDTGQNQTGGAGQFPRLDAARYVKQRPLPQMEDKQAALKGMPSMRRRGESSIGMSDIVADTRPTSYDATVYGIWFMAFAACIGAAKEPTLRRRAEAAQEVTKRLRRQAAAAAALDAAAADDGGDALCIKEGTAVGVGNTSTPVRVNGASEDEDIADTDTPTAVVPVETRGSCCLSGSDLSHSLAFLQDGGLGQDDEGDEGEFVGRVSVARGEEHGVVLAGGRPLSHTTSVPVLSSSSGISDAGRKLTNAASEPALSRTTHGSAVELAATEGGGEQKEPNSTNMGGEGSSLAPTRPEPALSDAEFREQQRQYEQLLEAIEFEWREEQLDNLRLAFQVLDHMQLQGIQADEPVFRSLIEACGRCGSVDRAVQAVKEMIRAGFVPDSVVYNCLVSAFSFSDSLSEMPLGFLAWTQATEATKGRSSIIRRGVGMGGPRKDVVRFSDAHQGKGVVCVGGGGEGEEGQGGESKGDEDGGGSGATPVATPVAIPVAVVGVGGGKHQELRLRLIEFYKVRDMWGSDGEGRIVLGLVRFEEEGMTHDDELIAELENEFGPAPVPAEAAAASGEGGGGAREGGRGGVGGKDGAQQDDAARWVHLNHAAFEDVIVDTTTCGSCPECNRLLDPFEIAGGFERGDANSYTTTCKAVIPSDHGLSEPCQKRFVPRFAVRQDVPGGAMADYKNEDAVWCEWLSPWVLRKEVSTILLEYVFARVSLMCLDMGNTACCVGGWG